MSTKIGKVTDFADGSATKVNVDGVDIAVVRIGGDFWAINDMCSHGNVSLSEGEVHADTKELEALHNDTLSGDDVIIEN